MAAVSCVDAALWVIEGLNEVVGKPVVLDRKGRGHLTGSTELTLLTDSGSLVSNVLGRRDEIKEKRLRGFMSILREELELGELDSVLHISGQKQLADPLTKMMDPKILIEFLQTGVMTLAAPSTASKKRSRKTNKYEPEEEVFLLDGMEVTEEDLTVYDWYEVQERMISTRKKLPIQEVHVTSSNAAKGAVGFLMQLVKVMAQAALRTVAESHE